MSQKSHRLIVIVLWLVMANLAIRAPLGLFVKPANDVETLNTGAGRNQCNKTVPPPAEHNKRATSRIRRVVWLEDCPVTVTSGDSLPYLNDFTHALSVWVNCEKAASAQLLRRPQAGQHDGLESVAMHPKALDSRE
jgi:hypothetical protein